jgi:F-type H+-transporting ATPase subunit b
MATETEVMQELATDVGGAAVEHAGDHAVVFPPFDTTTFASQLFWLAITFGLLYYLMARVIVPRIGGILEDRSDRIVGDLAEAARLKEESERVIETYEAELAEARRKAQAIAEERRTAVNADLAAKRASAEQGLAAKLAEAEASIRGIRDKALSEVDGIAADAAEAVVARLAPVTADAGEAAAAVARVKHREG